jgi:CRISPR system Cascade subunit CasE
MRALHRLAPGTARREERPRLIDEAGRNWLNRIAGRGGFTMEQVAVDGYRQHRIARGAGEGSIRFTSLDFQGVLSVGDPDRFLAALGQGFGAARAFGCGLMLIRRI